MQKFNAVLARMASRYDDGIAIVVGDSAVVYTLNNVGLVAKPVAVITQNVSGMGHHGEFSRGRHRFCIQTRRLSKRLRDEKRSRCRSVRRQTRIALREGRIDSLPVYQNDGWVLY